MQLNRESSPTTFRITHYRPGCVTINAQEYTNSVLITPTQLHTWAITKIQDLGLSDLNALLEYNPEVIIVGTGETLVFPAPEIMTLPPGHKIGIEFMSNSAACRTYTVLASQARKIVLALII